VRVGGSLTSPRSCSPLPLMLCAEAFLFLSAPSYGIFGCTGLMEGPRRPSRNGFANMNRHPVMFQPPRAYSLLFSLQRVHLQVLPRQAVALVGQRVGTVWRVQEQEQVQAPRQHLHPQRPSRPQRPLTSTPACWVVCCLVLGRCLTRGFDRGSCRDRGGVSEHTHPPPSLSPSLKVMHIPTSPCRDLYKACLSPSSAPVHSTTRVPPLYPFGTTSLQVLQPLAEHAAALDPAHRKRPGVSLEPRGGH
jgi:hypothetical protein